MTQYYPILRYLANKKYPGFSPGRSPLFRILAFQFPFKESRRVKFAIIVIALFKLKGALLSL